MITVKLSRQPEIYQLATVERAVELAMDHDIVCCNKQNHSLNMDYLLKLVTSTYNKHVLARDHTHPVFARHFTLPPLPVSIFCEVTYTSEYALVETHPSPHPLSPRIRTSQMIPYICSHTP